MPGKDRRAAVLDAAREVAMPIFVSTITTIVVFLPTIFLEEQSKLLFIPLTFTISFSLFASFLVSRTVTPLMRLHFLRPPRLPGATGRGLRDRFMQVTQRFFDRLDMGYQDALHWALAHRTVVVVGVLVLFVAALGLVPLIGSEFFPASDESQFRVFLRAPIGTRVEETEKVVVRVEQVVRHLRPEELVSTVGIPAGRSAIFTGNTGPHAAQVQVYLDTPDKRTRSDVEIVAALRPRFVGEFLGTVTYFNLGGIVNRVLNRGSQNPLEVELLGYDFGDAQAAAREVARVMRDVPGVADVQIGREGSYPQFSVVVERRLGGLHLPPGFRVQMGGQTAQQREAFSSLTFMSILALMLVYMVMASQFRSLKDPFIIMFSVPMGLIGVILALFLTRTTLSTTSFMGIIMMVGIVVSNGVLLIEYTNELRRRGLGLQEAVVRAGRTRLRPILMTSLTTICGLTPMALGWLVGGEANAPLARAVIGGLAVSTGLTLVLIPTLYSILEERFPRHLAAEEGSGA